MLIPTITFEIRNNEKGIVDEFVVENTIENQEKVFTHRFTRNIEFGQLFDFEFEKKQRIPSYFLGSHSEIEEMLDSVDEMVGVFA